jgi:peptidoglycan/LPS O-acetylase OafA/YrhL
VAKEHLLVLDGVRGTAAICVVVFHLSQPSFGNAAPDALWLRHAYLAVDFFFCLSGFVIGYAYDERHGRMSVVAFIRARLVRLHPMVVAGLLLGLVSFCFDPFGGSDSAHPWMQPQVAPLWKVAANVVGGLMMMPTWPLPNRFGAFFSLNSPAWSLMWEYFASVAFALLLWRMKRKGLSALVALAAAAIGVSAFHLNGLSAGFAWGAAKYGLIRIIFSFGMGLLIFRSGFVIRSRFGFGTLSLVMILLFVGPCGTQCVYNWAYDFALVTVALPLLVAIGAGADVSGLTGKVCDLCGRVSYPIYMVHYAVVMVFANYNWTHSIGQEAVPWVIGAITLGLIGFSYLVLVFYDEPVRQWVGSRWVLRNQTQRNDVVVLASECAGRAGDHGAPDVINTALFK